MVYSLDILPAWGYYTGVELLDGDRLKIGPLSPVNDGGVGWYGVPADPTYFPKHVKWMDRKGNSVPDFDAAQLISVSERARNIIEQIEPGVHQFLPVKFADIKGHFLEDRYWFMVCNRLDSVDRAKTTMVLRGAQWVIARDLVRRGESIPAHIDPNATPRIVFDLSAIGASHIWVDKHIGNASGFVSELVAAALRDAGMTGVRLTKQLAA
jgi:hypothetical protein